MVIGARSTMAGMTKEQSAGRSTMFTGTPRARHSAERACRSPSGAPAPIAIAQPSGRLAPEARRPVQHRPRPPQHPRLDLRGLPLAEDEGRAAVQVKEGREMTHDGLEVYPVAVRKGGDENGRRGRGIGKSISLWKAGFYGFPSG